MTKLIQKVAKLLPVTPGTSVQNTCPTRPMLTRKDIEALFARELGRKRFN